MAIFYVMYTSHKKYTLSDLFTCESDFGYGIS